MRPRAAPFFWGLLEEIRLTSLLSLHTKLKYHNFVAAMIHAVQEGIENDWLSEASSRALDGPNVQFQSMCSTKLNHEFVRQNRELVVPVPERTLLRFGSVALATLQAAGMNGAQDATCRVEGAEYLAGQASADQICRKFKQSMYSALDDAVDRDTISVTLKIEKGGTITAMLTTEGSGKMRTYHEVAIDVMDRALSLSDLDRLAKAAADALNTK